jgi:two-component system, OmpR family, osmolarity sensor histidine kinase EnvZ
MVPAPFPAPAPLRRRDSLFARLLLTQALLGLGFMLLFGALFYVERNVTVARLMAERWAPALREAAGAPASMPAAPALLRRVERPPLAITAPAIGPRMAALESALRQRGVPLADMAVALGEQGPLLWLLLEQADGQRTWIGLPGDEMLPDLSFRLLLGVLLGLLLLSFASWWFTRRLTRPLAQLRDHMLALRPEQMPQGAQAAAPAPVLAPGAAPELHAIDAAFAELQARHQRHQSERALLLAGVSHDLRSPLARIRMAAELLPDTADVAPRRDAIVRNTQLADRLIESFLDHVRSGELPLDERVDLAAIARATAERLQRPSAELRIDVAPTPVMARGNALLFERVIANLLDNAFAHGVPPVRLRVAIEAREAVIDVEDAGPGIAPAARATLLQAFARGEASRGKPGLGLGLAVVQRVVLRLGGRIEFAPAEAGPGHRIRVRLPL